MMLVLSYLSPNVEASPGLYFWKLYHISIMEVLIKPTKTFLNNSRSKNFCKIRTSLRKEYHYVKKNPHADFSCSVLSQNTGKYGIEGLGILTIFTQCLFHKLSKSIT